MFSKIDIYFIFKNQDPALLSSCYSLDNVITLENGEKKLISDSKIGDMVKSVNSNGELVNTEIVSIMHKNLNFTSKSLVLF